MQTPGRESEAGESVTVTMPLRADTRVLSAPFDDTQPFPPPFAAHEDSFGGWEETPVTRAPRPLLLADGAMSLEQATELRLEELRTARRAAPPNVTRHSEALVPACDADAPASSSRLCWRGIEVSDEFQGYALRVARGEELGPYRGRVLASGAPDFPWQAASVPTRGHRAARLVGLSIGALLAAVTAALGLLQAPHDTTYRDPSAAPGPPHESGAGSAPLASIQTRAGGALTVPASLSAPNTPPNPAPAPKPPQPAARPPQRPALDAQQAPATPTSPLLVEAPPF